MNWTAIIFLLVLCIALAGISWIFIKVKAKQVAETIKREALELSNRENLYLSDKQKEILLKNEKKKKFVPDNYNNLN